MKGVVRQIRRMPVLVVVRRHVDEVAIIDDLWRHVRLERLLVSAKPVHANPPSELTLPPYKRR